MASVDTQFLDWATLAKVAFAADGFVVLTNVLNDAMLTEVEKACGSMLEGGSGPPMVHPAWLHLFDCAAVHECLDEIMPNGFWFVGGSAALILGGAVAEVPVADVRAPEQDDAEPVMVTLEFGVEANGLSSGPVLLVKDICPEETLLRGGAAVVTQYVIRLPPRAVLLRDSRIPAGAMANDTASVRHSPRVYAIAPQFVLDSGWVWLPTLPKTMWMSMSVRGLLSCRHIYVLDDDDRRQSGLTRPLRSRADLDTRRLEKRLTRRSNRRRKNYPRLLTHEQNIALMLADRLTSLASTVSTSSSNSSALMRGTSLEGNAAATTSDDLSSDGRFHLWSDSWEKTMESQVHEHRCYVQVAICHRCRLGETYIWASDGIGLQGFKDLILASLGIMYNPAVPRTQLPDLTVKDMKLERDMQLRCYLTFGAPKPPVILDCMHWEVCILHARW
jgi:hypothetical protein